MKVAYKGQLDAIDQWLRDINNKLTMGISPTFLLNDCQKMQTDLREVAEKTTRVSVLQSNAPWNRR